MTTEFRDTNTVSRRGFLRGSAVAAAFAHPITRQQMAKANFFAQSDPANVPTSFIPFRSARPVWIAGRAKEMNLFASFVMEFPYVSDSVTLVIAAATLYRVHLNGQFCAFGPARGAHGYYRVDVLDLTPQLQHGDNTAVIEVAGYNINSYWTLNQPSFLQAEIRSGSAVLAATGEERSFRATLLPQRVQKVQRYSFQRAFSEGYRINPANCHWREGNGGGLPEAKCEIVPKKQLLPRRAAYPTYERRQPVKHVASGTIQLSSQDVQILRPRFLANIGPKLLGYKESDFDISPYVDLQEYVTTQFCKADVVYTPEDITQLNKGEFHIYDLGVNRTGFLGVSVTVTKTARLYITFDETLTKGDIDFMRLSCANIVAYDLSPGEYQLECFEPYTMRYFKFIAIDGEFAVRSPFLRTYESSNGAYARFAASNSGLNRLFLAGRETFRQNAVDLFTDCPSRERAGWLCDSYFTARTAFRLAGNSDIETAFFENFLLPSSFEFLPKGMLPMCYPADHYDGTYIANWAMWFVLQLEEYLQRSGNRVMVDKFRPRIMALLQHFRKFQNEDGLLENLSGKIFVEWSDANKYSDGVNYPTNMLYAAMLASVGRLYKEKSLEQAAEMVQAKIRHQSFDGSFFIDNALRQNGRLERTTNRTEICQYYAFYFGTVTAESHAELWKVLRDEFGPQRSVSHAYPEISLANALNGNVLRLELLSRSGHITQMLREAQDYLLYMAEDTGTLWEHVSSRASLDHAFNSHIVNVLYRDALGIYSLDTIAKHVELRFLETGLDWCDGSMPTPEGEIALSWARVGRSIQYRCNVPTGYSVRVLAMNGLPIQEV